MVSREKISAITQLFLASGFVIIAATLNEQSERSRPAAATPLVADLAAIQSQVMKPRPTTVKTRPKLDWTAVSQQLSSIEELKKLKLSEQQSRLLAKMGQDEFDRGNPFYALNQVYPLALILQKDVADFQRETYRSPHFYGTLGYDVVKYEIRHPDQSVSYILAYKERTAPEQTAIGQKDRRPSFSLYLVPQSEDQVFMSLYQEGQLVANQTVDRESALKNLVSRVNTSTPMIGYKSQ